jgi:hypothetical protein
VRRCPSPSDSSPCFSSSLSSVAPCDNPPVIISNHPTGVLNPFKLDKSENTFGDNWH